MFSQIYPAEYEGHFESLMISRQEILDCVKVLAEKIHKDYAGERPVIVCVLKGANSFYQHLLEALQELKHGYTTEFLRASSYEGTSSTGTVKVGGGLSYDALENKHVILVEDIVDTGTTLSHLMPAIQEKVKVKSMEVCSLLVKRLEQPPKVAAKYIGFSIPNHFIIGYGLDYNELYRDLRDIWVISKAGIEFDQSVLYK
jgi:hypoxanthine phosphoribosyltransferase